jgi:hypothetical protein
VPVSEPTMVAEASAYRMRSTRGIVWAWLNRPARLPTATSVPILSNMSMNRNTKTISKKPSRSVAPTSSFSAVAERSRKL